MHRKVQVGTSERYRSESAAMAAADALNKMDGYEITDADQRVLATGMGQLVGEFLLDREGIIRWSFTEVPDGGKNLFGAPTPQDLMSAASRVAA